jgi:hypothetical protein
MLIFQINPNQLEEGQEIRGKDWAFWNAYLSARSKENDYVLLPSYIDFITNTDISNGQEEYLVELDNTEEIT